MDRKKRLARLLTAYAILFFGFGVYILVFESSMFDLLDALQRTSRIGHPMDAPTEPFWKFVSISLLWMLGILCWWSRRDVTEYRNLIQLMIYAKFFSGGLLMAYFLLRGFSSPYFFGGLTDLSLGTVAAVYFLRAFPGAWRSTIRFSPGR